MKKKILNRIMAIIITAIFIWLFTSFIEVNTKNLNENPNYNEYNAFVMLMKCTHNRANVSDIG